MSHESDVETPAEARPAPGKHSTSGEMVQRKARDIGAPEAGAAPVNVRSAGDWMRAPDMMAAHGFVGASMVQRKAADAPAPATAASAANAANEMSGSGSAAEEARAATRDHVRLLQMIARVDSALRADSESKGLLPTWDRLHGLLVRHFQFEEQVLFPPILAGQDAGGGAGRMSAEHQEVHALMGSLRTQLAGGAAAAGELAPLLDEIDTHARIEEQTLGA